MNSTLIILLIILLLILLIFSAFFSAAETAYTAVNPAKFESDAQKKHRAGMLIKKHINSYGWILATILLGNNFVNVALSTITSFLIASFFDGNNVLPTIISIVIVTPIIVVLGEIIPKLLAKKYSYGYLKKIVYTMEFFKYLFLPFTFFISKLVLRSKVTHTENEIKSLLNIASSEGVLQKREATLAKNALDLDSIIVSETMTPIKKMVFVKHDDLLKTCKEIFISSGLSRLVVKKKELFLGILHIKDIVNESDENIVAGYVKKVPNISRNMILTNALEILRRERVHFAFVTKTMGSSRILGLITLEDILEELVGEIYDEHDQKLLIREIGLHKYVAVGFAKASELEKKLQTNLQIPNKKMTIQQWVNSRINRSIKKNLQYTYKNKIKFKVISNKKGEPVKFEITQI